MSNPIEPLQSKHYLFVIDTDSYAGNFERAMCAYLTGQVGDCGVGEEQAEIAKQEIPDVVAKLEDLVMSVPDEHGCHRPVSIFPNPRYGNDGHGKHALLTDKNRKRFSFYAYNSVAIYFNSLPDSELLEALKERAKNIELKEIELNRFEPTPRIEGFRLFEQQTTYKEL